MDSATCDAGPLDAAPHDIVDHIVTLIPLEDHATVSALASTCHAYRGLFTQFLRVNGIVDLRAIGPDDPIDLCDRFHGELRRNMTEPESRILRLSLRADVLYMSRNSNYAIYDTLYRFEYGVPVYRRTTHPRVICISEQLSRGGLEVTVCTCITVDSSTGIIIELMLCDRPYDHRLIGGSIHLARAMYIDDEWICTIWSPRQCNALGDLDALLAPYQWQAQWLLSEHTQLSDMREHHESTTKIANTIGA